MRHPEHQRWQRLDAAFGNGACTITQAFAALQQVGDARMGLEALEFFKWRQVGVGVIQVHDKADRDQVFAMVVDEGAAAGVCIQWPAHAVLYQPWLVLCLWGCARLP